MNFLVYFLILLLISQFYSLPIKINEFQTQKTEIINSFLDTFNKSTINYRCGTPDQIYLTRHKRYATVSKWPKNNLTWRFDKNRNENKKFLNESDKIRRRIYEAMNAWAYHTNLRFQEKSANAVDVDIEILFVPEHHEHLDIYKFNPYELAHAFYPHQNNPGDVHLNDEINWDFNSRAGESAKDGKFSFYGVFLHELGHALGLNHSENIDSTMHASYSDDTSELKEDDIKGIQANYGIPNNYSPTTTIRTTTTRQIIVRRPTSTEIPLSDKPDRCYTSYDAVMTFNGELFIFKGQYMFRPIQYHKEADEIRRMWEELPKNLTHIDAAFQLKNSKILFFIDQRIFLFNMLTLEREMTLNDTGIGSDVTKIDAIFRMHHNQETYIISGDKYWKFDEKNYNVSSGYPKQITRFRGVYDIDTAITYERKLYFFKGKYFYEFNTKDMSIDNKKPQLSANKFMKCNIKEYQLENEIDEKGNESKKKKSESYVSHEVIFNTNNSQHTARASNFFTFFVILVLHLFHNLY